MNEPKKFRCMHKGRPCPNVPSMLMIWGDEGPFPLCNMHGHGLIAIGASQLVTVLTHPLFNEEDAKGQPSWSDLMKEETQAAFQLQREALAQFAAGGHMAARFLVKMEDLGHCVPIAAVLRTNETIRANLEFEKTLQTIQSN